MAHGKGDLRGEGASAGRLRPGEASPQANVSGQMNVSAQANVSAQTNVSGHANVSGQEVGLSS
ncbi:hypothetical protein GCM10023156_21930 [Novipirellula rosea]|uniref:Uncharacterized protein n=1 Tax=Novipirellula rosea TaxID=1031540 RepID=A0ABP8MPV4_9BACT